MKKYLLALILVLAMAMTAMPAFAGGIQAVDHGAINLNYLTPADPNFYAGGHLDGTRDGSVTAKFGLIGATGDINGQIIGKGYHFDDLDTTTFGKSDFAGSGAFAKVTGNAWELAGGLLSYKPSVATSVMLEGNVGQGNQAFAQVGLTPASPTGSFAQAFGGNESGARFKLTDLDVYSSDKFQLLYGTGSSVCGDAWTKGETRVFASVEGELGEWGKSTAWGFTKNFGEGNMGVWGKGDMTTQTLIQNPLTGNWATTLTTSSFQYSDPSYSLQQSKGFGIAGGWGQSILTAIPNGVKASSHSFSYAIAK